jgi:hypothetical protein
MDKESKLKRLTTILNEYIKYLKVHDKVKIEIIYKHITHDVHIEQYKDSYDTDRERMIVIEKKIPNTEFVKVTYFDCKLPNYESVFESIEFPIEKLDKRIEHYENKVKYLKEKQENARKD